MSFFLNILWLIFGGLMSALAWMLASVVMFITIIGIPWARATFNIGVLTFLPFGAKAVSRNSVSGPDIGTGILGTIGNVIWFLLAGLWLFLYHLAWTVLLFLTIIGIPFGLQHWKLAKISLSPIGKQIVWK